MKSKLKTIYIVVLACSISSCTLLFLPNKQKITISTTNETAVVYDNEYEIGRGKNITTKVKKDGAKQLVVQTPGYKDEYKVVLPFSRPSAFYPLYVLDFVTIWGPLITHAVPKTFNYKSDWTIENVNKLDKRSENQKSIFIESVKINLQNKNDFQDYRLFSKGDFSEMIKKAIEDRALEIQKQNKSVSDKNTLQQNIDKEKEIIKENKYLETLHSLLKKTEYIDTVNKVFQDNNNTIVLEGEIRKIDIFTIVRKGIMNSPGLNKAGLGMQWYIKNIYDEIIDSAYTYEYSGEYLINYSIVTNVETFYNDAIENNYLKLKQAAEFQKNIVLNTDFSSKDEKLSITQPTSLVKAVDEASLASVIIKCKDKGHGSGFAISNDGYILTNFHVISGKNIDQLEEVKVVLSNGDELDAKIVRYNRACDMALLKVDYDFEKAFLLKSTKDFKNLLDVYTIGAPKSVELGQSVTMGMISNERKANKNNLIQLNISINGGNSGGPLFDKTGMLHGVIQSKLVGYATEGIGFAIPSYLIADYLNIIIAK